MLTHEDDSGEDPLDDTIIGISTSHETTGVLEGGVSTGSSGRDGGVSGFAKLSTPWFGTPHFTSTASQLNLSPTEILEAISISNPKRERLVTFALI